MRNEERPTRERAVYVTHGQPCTHAYNGPIAMWQGSEN